MNTVTYLFAGYAVIWAIIFGYTLILGGRQKKLEEEISLLKRALTEKR